MEFVLYFDGIRLQSAVASQPGSFAIFSWDWLDDSDVLAVEHPSGEYRGYCIVMGSGGLAYGLAVYIGDAGLAGYLTLMTGEVDPESLDALDHTNALSAMLADREHLETKDRATIRELGLKYRGRGRWPLFRRTIPGYLPWHLDADEAVFLTMALRNVMDMASKAASGETVLHSESGPSLVLTRVFRGGAWQDQWEPFELPQPPAPVPYPDAERLQRLAQSKSKGPEVWELAFFYLPTPMQEEKGERPYLPMTAPADSSCRMRSLLQHRRLLACSRWSSKHRTTCCTRYGLSGQLGNRDPRRPVAQRRSFQQSQLSGIRVDTEGGHAARLLPGGVEELVLGV
jgi:hypothetical protein